MQYPSERDEIDREIAQLQERVAELLKAKEKRDIKSSTKYCKSIGRWADKAMYLGGAIFNILNALHTRLKNLESARA